MLIYVCMWVCLHICVQNNGATLEKPEYRKTTENLLCCILSMDNSENFEEALPIYLPLCKCVCACCHVSLCMLSCVSVHVAMGQCAFCHVSVCMLSCVNVNVVMCQCACCHMSVCMLSCVGVFTCASVCACVYVLSLIHISEPTRRA